MLTDLRLYREEKTEITYLNMNTLSCELKDIWLYINMNTFKRSNDIVAMKGLDTWNEIHGP